MNCYLRKLSSLLVVGAGLISSADAAPLVIDDFDGGSDARLQSFSISPTTGSPHFPNGIFDVFGVTDRTVNFDFADDSAGSFPADRFGVVPTAKTDKFFGVEDLLNPDQPGGRGTATWTFDIAGLTNLSLQILFSAMGDFEAGDNSHIFEVAIDGGGFSTVFNINGDNNDTFGYTMEGGFVVNLADPLKLTDDLGTRIIDNSFTTLGTSAILGTGNLLTLRYTAGTNDGGSEVFAFDNIILNADPVGGGGPVVPEPTSLALAAIGVLAAFARRAVKRSK